MGRSMLRAFVLLLMLPMAGCGDFSLLDQFRFLDLELEKNVVHPGEECRLTTRGGMAPFTFTVMAGSIFDDGINPDDSGAIADMVYTAGSSIGSVKIGLQDSAGHGMETLITVLPWKPQTFSAATTGTGPAEVTLSWSYETPGFISGFSLWRSKAGGPYVEIAAPGILERGFVDSSAGPQLNEYRLFAVAGDYQSEFAEASAQGL